MSKHLIGNLLVATPIIVEPPFCRSVILVCSHDKNHAMGFIINKINNELDFKTLCKEIKINSINKYFQRKVLFGGPVELTRGFVIHTNENLEPESHLINSKFSLTSSVKIIKDIAFGNGPNHSRVIMGYSGWNPGQLELELKQNSWLTLPATKEIVFSPDTEAIWFLSLKKLGIDPKKFTAHYGHA